MGPPLVCRYANLRGHIVTMFQGPKVWEEDPVEREGKRQKFRNRVPLGGA